jgi:Holliday junction resolvase
MSWIDLKWLFKENSISPVEIEQMRKELKAEERQKKETQRLLKEKAAREDKEKTQQELFARNEDLVKKFLQIAERKISIIDDYGDEKWEALPSEIENCLKKIAQRENKKIDWKRCAKYSYLLPTEYQWLRHELENVFRIYHLNQQARSFTRDDLSTMTGIEFEAWIVKLLKENGFDDVRGTPATGDQGADILANKDGRHIVIQAKRHKGTVSNKAVQEVIAALQYYGGNEGWVITNSTFTPSAVALAQKSKIRLIDREGLAHIEDFINRTT